MCKIIFLLGLIVVFVGCGKEKGSISGKVTNGGVGQKDAIVLAILGDSLAAGQNINPNNLKGTIVTSTDGSYKILLVDAGTYVVVAINDKNGNFVFDDTLDEIGYYGHIDTTTGITIPDKVILNKGEDKTGIDIDTLHVLPH